LCAGLESLYSYRPAARAAAEWTVSTLTSENRAYLEKLPRGPLPYEGFDMVHGSPLDEDEYLMTTSDVAIIHNDIDTKLSFFGHTHLQGGFLIARNSVTPIDRHRALQLEGPYPRRGSARGLCHLFAARSCCRVPASGLRRGRRGGENPRCRASGFTRIAIIERPVGDLSHRKRYWYLAWSPP
jgi:hypothetical protein